jgi:hypothetical protein
MNYLLFSIKVSFLFILISTSIIIQKKTLFFICCTERNFLNINKHINPLLLVSKESILFKNSFILNKGIDDTYKHDEKIDQNELNRIEQNLKKKRILDFLLDNNTCSCCKLQLIENYSFLFNEYKDKGLKKDFDEFLSS